MLQQVPWTLFFADGGNREREILLPSFFVNTKHVVFLNGTPVQEEKKRKRLNYKNLLRLIQSQKKRNTRAMSLLCAKLTMKTLEKANGVILLLLLN